MTGGWKIKKKKKTPAHCRETSPGPRVIDWREEGKPGGGGAREVRNVGGEPSRGSRDRSWRKERNPDRFAEAVAHAGGGGGGEEGPPTKTPGPVFPKWWSQTPVVVVVVTQAALVTRRNPGPFPSRRRVEGKARRWGRLGLRG